MSSSTTNACEPDLEAARKLVLEMMAIPGPSRQEGAIIEFIVDKLRSAGVPASAIATDQAHEHSPYPGGEIGNLIVKLRSKQKLPRRLLMAHVDTVPLCVGCEPVIDGDFVRSANPETALGGDDRAGAAVILTAALEILRRKLPHPPLTFFWPVQEELGAQGARFGTLSSLGKPQLAFNWDGALWDHLTVGATGAYRLNIKIHGVPSHAGSSPELGVSAITIASLAMSRLHNEGWLGDVHKGRHHGTSNVGVISGGTATNVVTSEVTVAAEVRSHDAKFRLLMVQTFRKAFEQAAQEVQNKAGVHGSVTFAHRKDYESFALEPDEPCVQAASAAVRSLGGEPTSRISNGGLDANWLSERGIPTVTLGCGQFDIHTTQETLHLPTFDQACRVALRLATGSEAS